MAFAALCLSTLTCAPDWGDDPALIVAPRIVAIEMDPPEAAPGAAVSFTAVVATPGGPAELPVRWSFCRSPKPLAENGAVDQACVTPEPPTMGADAPTFKATIPQDACRLFGPETPPRTGNGPPARPRDPDATGGYYQPVIAAGVGKAAVASLRIACNLGSAPLDVAMEFRRRYRANKTPRLEEITAVVDGRPTPLDAIPPGRPAELVARWSPDTAEHYVAFDPATQALVERRESIRVSWFVTEGSVEHPHVGRGEDESEDSVSTIWRPRPGTGAGGRVYVWSVVRDSRGGVSGSARELLLGK